MTTYHYLAETKQSDEVIDKIKEIGIDEFKRIYIQMFLNSVEEYAEKELAKTNNG